MKRAFLLAAMTVACRLWAASPQADVLVFAPHPDDESLGCGGILAQAVAQGKTAKVVLVTSGDAFPDMASLITKKPVEQLVREDYLELARFRQNQARQAVTSLGLKAQDLILLGYPDSALDRIYQFQGTAPFRQEYTQKSETYGLIQPDYHSATHGAPAPYTRTAVLADLAELIQTLQPKQIYVTASGDQHPDHRAAFWFVRDAAKSAQYKGEFYTYLIHGGPEWPWPSGITPELPLQAHTVRGEVQPAGVSWPPPRRVPLTREQAELKLRAIRAHSSHLAQATEPSMIREREYLESFVKSEEVFWPATWE